MPHNPYREDLGGRDPIQVMAETPRHIESLVSNMTADDLKRSYAPGKWTAAQLLVHLAQTELALTHRARMALSEAGYTAQPFNQDAWMDRESGADAATALRAYLALRALNLQMYRGLTAADRARSFRHPEYSEQLTVDWLLEMIAGHELHHVPHLEAIAGRR